ncbi:hypothetical protein [Amycolatopsis endophytica]|nr:hypothetical protein [Amycolatopsis endophytica]
MTGLSDGAAHRAAAVFDLPGVRSALPVTQSGKIRKAAPRELAAS